MEAKDIKWCPQHGYPLPCDKCGYPLSQLDQKQIFESGRKSGIKEVVEWLGNNAVCYCGEPDNDWFEIDQADWMIKLKEWMD